MEKLDANNRPDAELVAAYKSSGNQDWLAVLYQRYAGLLFGVCLKYLEDAETARDACADIYEELVQKLLKHEVDHFKGWLHVLAKNHCLQKLRAAKKMPAVHLTDSFVQSGEMLHLEEVMLKENSLNALQHCINQLTEEQKKTIEMFYLEDKCYNDIVEATGLSWNMVRSHIQNGRRNLKICMEHHESGK